MRTTICLDEQLPQAAKREAVETGRTLTAVIEDALREAVARRHAATPRKRLILSTFKGVAASRA